MHEGKRITDAHTLKLVTMVYAGLINKDIVARLQSIGCNAIGLCGADGNTIPSVKRLDDKIDWGYVGDVDINEINYELIFNLLELGLQPVFSAITHDKMGNLMNTNADTIASSIANALAKAGKEVALVYCFEKKGVLRDVNDQSSVIKEIKTGDYADLKNSGVIHSGMIPKLDNAFKSIQAGVNLVKICMAEDLYDWENAGTSIKK
jgi:acetylglutamate kinase